MAQSGPVVRDKITAKIFNSIVGSTINVYALTSTGDGNYGGYGGTSKVYGSPLATIGVPYGTLTANRQYNNMGFNAEGESKIALPHTTVIKSGDIVQIPVSGLYGEVLVVNDYPYGNVSLATIITIKELLVTPQFELLDLEDSLGILLQDSLGEQLQVTS